MIEGKSSTVSSKEYVLRRVPDAYVVEQREARRIGYVIVRPRRNVANGYVEISDAHEMEAYAWNEVMRRCVRLEFQSECSELPCEFCMFEFDREKLGRYGCPNCQGEGLQDKKLARELGLSNETVILRKLEFEVSK